MYKYLAIVLLILLSYCGNRSDEYSGSLTEEQKRKYFIDSFALAYGFGYYETDSARSFSTFLKNNYPGTKALNTHDAFPYALEEEYIDTTNIDQNRTWFRVIVTKPFQPPYCIKTERRYERNYLTAKITNGDGGYYTGTLAATFTIFIKDSMVKELFSTLDTMKFWEQNHHDTATSPHTHPELWVVEAINNGKYNYIVRLLPNMKKRKEFDKLIRQVSQLKDALRLKETISAWGGEGVTIQ